jgi:non-specific serine/threonine protein kinase
MDAAPRDQSRWQFARHELDESSLELRTAGELVAIERKPLELLMLLLRHPGEVLTKDELLDAVWGGRVLSESVLTKCVAKLRQALGDDDQQLIKTVHGYGYRLMAAVTRLDAPAAPLSEPVSGLKSGDSPPLRPNWVLVRRFAGSRGESWLVEHAKTHEQRVLKFARGAEGLRQLKREITIFRLLLDTHGPRDDLLRVLDWNLEELPFFIETEYCTGGSLKDWAAEPERLASLDLAARLDIVIQTAEALAAAHAAGVLHKDLKPANLLVEPTAAGRLRVRLGDFGSGRVLQAERLSALDITQMGFTQTLLADESTSGTWSYLAPEVIAGQPPTVRSDIYALGVLLYQLTVADLRRPLAPGWERDIDDALLREDIAACCDQQPEHRPGDAAEIARRLRELDSRREQRAEQTRAAAAALAAQQALERARSRRAWLGGIAAVAVAGLVVALALLWQVGRAERAASASAAEAAERAQVAQAVNEFLTRDLIQAADPLRSGTRDQTLLAALKASEASIGTRFAGQPLQEAAIQRALGNAYYGVSEFDAAQRAFERSLALAAQAKADPDSRIQTSLELFDVLHMRDELGAQRAVLDAAHALVGDARVSARTRLQLQISEAALLNRSGRYADAVRAYEQLREPARTMLGERDAAYAELISLLAEAQANIVFDERALALAREGLALKRVVHGERHPRALEEMRQFAASLRNNERHDESEATLTEAMAIAEAALGPEHDVTLRIATEWALLDLDRGRLVDAERRFRSALEIRERVFGIAHRDTRTTLGNLAYTLGEQGRLEESLAIFKRAHAANVAAVGPKHADPLVSLQNIARTHMELNQWREAAQVQQQLLAVAAEVIPDHWHRAVMLQSAGETQARLGNPAAARQHLQQAVEIFTASRGPDDARTVGARTALAALGAAGAASR